MSATPAVITVAAVVKAPVEKVWDCFTLPEHITQWNFAVPEWHCPSATNDLRTGGRFSSRMEARDGSMGFDFSGVYTEVRPQQHIAYTMDDGRKATVDFTPAGTTTKVTTSFEAESQNPVEMQQGGWQAILDNFKRYAEAL
jgi:uncharacterized protein YndB with AHSA1/START domain